MIFQDKGIAYKCAGRQYTSLNPLHVRHLAVLTMTPPSNPFTPRRGRGKGEFLILDVPRLEAAASHAVGVEKDDHMVRHTRHLQLAWYLWSTAGWPRFPSWSRWRCAVHQGR
jgi:hypothetical protein